MSLEWLLDSFLGKDHPEVLEKGMTTAQVCVATFKMFSYSPVLLARMSLSPATGGV